MNLPQVHEERLPQKSDIPVLLNDAAIELKEIDI